jgi:hypothetical protein
MPVSPRSRLWFDAVEQASYPVSRNAGITCGGTSKIG